MKTFLIEPLDPLIARDGRPSAVGRFESLPFPLPSTIAGAARTRMASSQGYFDLEKDDAAKLLQLSVHGPLLARLDDDQVSHYYAPAPRDAALFASEGGIPRRLRLAPRSLPAGGLTGPTADLQRIGFAARDWDQPIKDKSLASAPAFWPWSLFQSWLTNPDEDDFHTDLGLKGLPREARVHLAIRPGERVGEEGALFATEGLRFLDGPDGSLNPARLALSFRAEEDAAGELLGRALQLRDELAPLGGERRLARWRSQQQPWPKLPDGLRAAVRETGFARLILLSPAIFSDGALPRWNGSPFPDHASVKIRIKAACVPRATVVSGWDLSARQAKPTRRLAVAGSVYFVQILGEKPDIEAWCDKVWLKPISDQAQDRRDGFGLAALGVWPQEQR